MHRRRFLQSSAIAGTASPMVFTAAMAQQQAIPEATPAQQGNATLADRIARIEPEALLEALLTTPVTTHLFPSDTPPVETVAWEDTGDADLDNAVGGVVFNTGYDENDNFVLVGVAIVHPNADSAAAAVAETGSAPRQSFIELPWFMQVVVDNAVSGVRIGNLILVGGADSPSGEPAEAATMTLRAISHMTALIDHLEGVLSDLGAD